MKTLTIRMKADDTAEVLLYDVIGEDMFGGISASDFREQVMGIKVKTLNLRINSPGGSVWEAQAMMIALNEFKTKRKGRIETDIDGIAASAASVIAMSGDVVRIASGGFFMIHDPMWGLMIQGGAEDLRKAAKELDDRAAMLDKTKENLIDAYASKTGASREQIAAWMTAETWFIGQEAVTAGFVDSVTQPVRIAALAQHSAVMAKLKYKHVPTIPQNSAEWDETRRRQEIAAKIVAKAGPCSSIAVSVVVPAVPATSPAVTAQAFAVGDMVQWLVEDAEELSAEMEDGVIQAIESNGALSIPGTSVTLKGTAEDPAVLVYDDDDDEECWYLVRMSKLKPMDPSDLEPNVVTGQ